MSAGLFTWSLGRPSDFCLRLFTAAFRGVATFLESELVHEDREAPPSRAGGQRTDYLERGANGAGRIAR